MTGSSSLASPTRIWRPCMDSIRFGVVFLVRFILYCNTYSFCSTFSRGSGVCKGRLRGCNRPREARRFKNCRITKDLKGGGRGRGAPRSTVSLVWRNTEDGETARVCIQEGKADQHLLSHVQFITDSRCMYIRTEQSYVYAIGMHLPPCLAFGSVSRRYGSRVYCS